MTSATNIKENDKFAEVYYNGDAIIIETDIMELIRVNVLKNYESVSSVANDGYDPSFVSKVCRGDKSIAYGYIWRFK